MPAAESAGTRDRILDAAREEFSARGYEKTSVRGIAKAAGVDSALVHHYFGTKERVFEAAVEVAFGPALAERDALLEGPRGRRARSSARVRTRSPAPRSRDRPLPRRQRHRCRRIAGQLGRPDAELRAELAAAQLVGIAMIRYVIRIEPLASADPEDIVRRVAPVVQGHLTGP